MQRVVAVQVEVRPALVARVQPRAVKMLKEEPLDVQVSCPDSASAIGGALIDPSALLVIGPGLQTHQEELRHSKENQIPPHAAKPSRHEI